MQEDTLYTTLGERIHRLRVRYGLTQIQFCHLLDIHQANESAWETGKRCPSVEKLTELGMTFSVSLDWLIGVSPIPYTEFVVTAAECRLIQDIKDLEDDPGYVFYDEEAESLFQRFRLSIFFKDYQELPCRQARFRLSERAHLVVLLHLFRANVAHSVGMPYSQLQLVRHLRRVNRTIEQLMTRWDG
jgi:transcriptional regulator with XRE-family HTH domain